MTLLDKSTISIRETYHKIDPSNFPEVEYYCGRPLNLPEDCDDFNDSMENFQAIQSPENIVSSDGHKTVYVNEIFEDSEGRQFRVIDVLGNGTFSYVFKC